MAIEVELTGDGRFKGAASAITDYSVTEEATPMDAADTSGGVGEVTFNAVDDPSRAGSVQLIGTTVELTDSERGVVSGTITDLNSVDSFITVNAESRLGPAVTTVDADAFNGTFGDAVTYYLGLANVSGDISVDAGLASQAVVAPGWRDSDLWTKFKELLTVYGAEVVQIGGVITVRPVRSRILTPKNAASTDWALVENEKAKRVEVYYYNSEYKTNYTIYPDGGWTEDETVYTVDANEITTVNIPVNMFLTSVEQPVVLDYVPRLFDDYSAYCVAGADGFKIAADLWTDEGGDVTFAIGEDGKSIDVTITGPGGRIAAYAPYRIATTALDGNYYSSLRIRATGVYARQASIISHTGAGEVATDIGVTVDNQFISSKADAWAAAMSVARRFVGPIMTVTRRGAKAVVDAGTEMGNVVGSRFKFRRSMYRVKSTTISPSGVDYTAEADTTFADFNSEATGMTFADFNTLYAGMTFGEFSRAPLPNPDVDNDRY